MIRLPQESTRTPTMQRRGARQWLTGIVTLLLLGGVATATGCRQAQGERCQITSDCEEGLVCEVQGNSPSMGGVCRGSSTPAPQTQDLATPQDLSAVPDMASADGPDDGGGADARDAM